LDGSNPVVTRRPLPPAPLYRDAPEARAAVAAGNRIIPIFMQETLPGASEASRALAGKPITSTLTGAGKQFSESPRTFAEIKTYAEAMTDMFCAYLGRQNRRVHLQLSLHGSRNSPARLDLLSLIATKSLRESATL
jgi:Tetracyclin repressor-like, C-terminal domain